MIDFVFDLSKVTSKILSRVLLTSLWCLSIRIYLTFGEENVASHESHESFRVWLGRHRRDSFGVFAEEPLFREGFRLLIEIPLLKIVNE